MRILYLNHNVVGRGTWVRAAGLARELVSNGHHVTVLTTSLGTRMRSREYEWHGVHVIEAPDLLAGPARTGWDAWNTSWRVQRLARERFDLVHGMNEEPIDYPGRDLEEQYKSMNASLPHVVGQHREVEEAHVYEDIMQLVDWIREDKPTISTAEHARHVVEIFDAAYRAAESGQAQNLRTTF